MTNDISADPIDLTPLPGVSADDTAASTAAVAPEIISFPTGDGKSSVQVDAAGVPHISIPITSSTKAKVGTTLAGITMAAQFALDYILTPDTTETTVVKVGIWVVGVAATALGIYLPTNKAKTA